MVGAPRLFELALAPADRRGEAVAVGDLLECPVGLATTSGVLSAAPDGGTPQAATFVVYEPGIYSGPVLANRHNLVFIGSMEADSTLPQQPPSTVWQAETGRTVL